MPTISNLVACPRIKPLNANKYKKHPPLETATLVQGLDSLCIHVRFLAGFQQIPRVSQSLTATLEFEHKRKRQRPKREFDIVMSGQFRTLAMCYFFTVTMSTMERVQSFFCWFTRFLFDTDSPADIFVILLILVILVILVRLVQSISFLTC